MAPEATRTTSAHEAITWVPVEACTLPTAEQPLRLREFDSVFSLALRSVERAGPAWLQLRLADDDGVEQLVRDLTAREVGCCGFFDFSVNRADRELVLDVRVPASRAAVLDGLALQAATAGARADR